MGEKPTHDLLRAAEFRRKRPKTQQNCEIAPHASAALSPLDPLQIPRLQTSCEFTQRCWSDPLNGQPAANSAEEV
jgi:hypothetical protein